MKFGKEFMSQMVPEWQEAYMDYNYLKSLLKEIANFKRRTTPVESVSSSNVGLKRRISLYRAFSGLTKNNSKEDEEDQVILVNTVQQEGSEGCYQTLFLMSAEDGGQYELMFFKRLDDEFNKVIKFYKSKVQEVMNEAEEINKQMDALIALRLEVDIPAALGLERDRPPPPMHPATNTGNKTSPGKAHMEVIHEVEMSSDQGSENKTTGSRNMNNGGSRPAPLEVLDHVKINVKLETPWSTLKSVLMHSRSNDLTFTDDELREVEEQLKQALVGFHQKLRLLKNYSFLNLMAFSKIMKKYDKVSSRHASKAYLKMVDNSDIGSSDEVTRLMERVEATFIKHFSNANRRKGISALKPQIKRERHRVTFFSGLFLGCSIALVVAIAVLLHARNIFRNDPIFRSDLSKGRDKYMRNIFPLYSLFIFIVIHMIMYSADVFFWRRYRVNYPFIFGFKQGTELGYRQVFLVTAGIAVLALAGVLSNLDMDTEPKTEKFKALTELVPLGLLLVLLAITLCPFNIIYRSSRFFLLQCLGHCILAPLYKVTLPDFFLADQLTSQVQAIRSLQFYICYYATGDFRKRTNSCRGGDVYDVFYLGVAVIPYWFRLAQCLRRLFEEKDAMQGWNGLKYFSTIVSVVMRTVHDQRKANIWKFMAGGSSAVATLANLYWDLVIDWGLLNWNSRNFLLRDKLLVPHKSVYFVAMVLDVILRFAWLQSILGFRVFFLHDTALVATFACLEIIRRGIWNFFRLENEHLNNVGKYRAFKTVPLPFNYDDEDKDG